MEVGALNVHVIPEGDLVAHEPNETCVCGPLVEWVPGGFVYVHPALDGRARDELELEAARRRAREPRP